MMNKHELPMNALPREGRASTARLPLGGTAALIAACGLGLGLPAAAQEDKEESATSAIPAQVETILRSMSELLGSAKGLSLRAEIIQDDALESGLLIQRTATLEVVADRPGSIQGLLSEGNERRKLWSDGKTATLYDITNNVFTRTKVPGKIGPTLDFLAEKYGLSMPLGDLFYENPYEVLTANIGQAFYIGYSEVDGVTCHQLAFTQDAIDWQLWVEAGVRPVPRRLVIVYKLLPGSPRYMATVTSLDLRSSPLPGSFNPILRDDAEEMEMLEIQSLVSPK